MNFGDPTVFAAVALLGWLMGSFNTVLCHRIPREIPLGVTSHQRSQCPHCKKTIPWYQNIPLFTWLFQRGRCAMCDGKIPTSYFLIELTTLVFFCVTYLVFENSRTKPVENFVYWAELAKLLWFTIALIATIFIDIEFRIIPDRFSLGGWVIAALAAIGWGEPPPVEALVGGAAGFGVFFLMSWSYEKLKGVEGLGFGDVKMMGWLGTWVGIYLVPFVILCASLSGLLVGLVAMRTSKDGFKTAIPFGPFLALGGYLGWVLSSLGYF